MNLLSYLVLAACSVLAVFAIRSGLRQMRILPPPRSAPRNSGQLLVESGLPRPEALLFNMLALKVAAEPADAKWVRHDQLVVSLPSGGGVLLHWHDIRQDEKAARKARVFRVKVLKDENEEWNGKELIRLPGDCDVLEREIFLLYERSAAKKLEEEHAASQNTALSALEALLAPIQQDSTGGD